MTPEDLISYAKSVVDGGPVKKAEVVAFMKALLEQTDAAPEEPAADPDLQAGGPAMSLEEVAQTYLPVLGFEVEKTETGIHMPRESNRSYTKVEATALLKMIADALR